MKNIELEKRKYGKKSKKTTHSMIGHAMLNNDNRLLKETNQHHLKEKLGSRMKSRKGEEGEGVSRPRGTGY